MINNLYIGIWRDRNIHPYFIISDDYLSNYCKLVRVDFKTGEILPNRNIFRRLKLTDNDIQDVYEVLPNKTQDIYNITNWEYICFSWNQDIVMTDFMDTFDLYSWVNGKYDEIYKNKK